MKAIMIFSMLITTMFVNMSHPIMILMCIILQTLNMCTLLWLISKSSWLSFVLFIIFLGGLMVLFVYITSLASNEKLVMNFEKLFYSTTLFLVVTTLLNKNMFEPITKTPTLFFMDIISPILMKSNSLIIYLLMIYLLVTLLVAVKISNKYEGPLRNLI